jgi:chemotaxis response regulator CheB
VTQAGESLLVRLQDGRLQLTPEITAALLAMVEAAHQMRAAICSAAQPYGASVLGVVLTGMGVDGTHGARAIRDAGGEVFVQDQASSVVWGMPGSIVGAGMADGIVPLQYCCRCCSEGLVPTAGWRLQRLRASEPLRDCAHEVSDNKKAP